jgi:hypothetical protein
MKRLGVVLWVALTIALLQLGWTWLERHNGNLRIGRTTAGLRGRTGAAGAADTGTTVKIAQFYAREAMIVDGERDVICYGVHNARSVRIEPEVEQLSPALVRCFWVDPHEDTTYRMIAEGEDGSRAEASFTVRVRPAPPVFRMMAVSDREIPPGEVVTVCYGVERAMAVRLDPIGWKLPAVAKNCIRFYPKSTLNYTLVATGTAGLEEREKFRVRVRE